MPHGIRITNCSTRHGVAPARSTGTTRGTVNEYCWQHGLRALLTERLTGTAYSTVLWTAPNDGETSVGLRKIPDQALIQARFQLRFLGLLHFKVDADWGVLLSWLTCVVTGYHERRKLAGHNPLMNHDFPAPCQHHCKLCVRQAIIIDGLPLYIWINTFRLNRILDRFLQSDWLTAQIYTVPLFFYALPPHSPCDIVDTGYISSYIRLICCLRRITAWAIRKLCP